MNQLQIQLLGTFQLCYNQQPITTVNTPRLQALVAYLALHLRQPVPRQRLAFLFWPDSSEAQARTNLRKQLLFLRQALPAFGTLLAADRQQIWWVPDTALELDVAAFCAALTAAESVADSKAITALRTAVDGYTGELLPDCYDEWIFGERERLHTQYGHALMRLVHLLEVQRHYDDALFYAHQLLTYDPLQENTYRRLMRLHVLNGDRAAALQVYHLCVEQLHTELNVAPDSETQAFYGQLRQQPSQPTAVVAPLAVGAPFVARDREWQTLQHCWRQAQRGSPHFVLIAGEAGIGKTRLAEELLQWAHHQGIAVARARVYRAEGRLAYAPLIEWLRVPAIHTYLPKLAATWRTELARLLPELLTADPALPTPEPLTQSWQRGRLFEALIRALLISGQPRLLLLDDLQWCDLETLEWLHFALRFTDNAPPADMPPARLLLLGTARFPDEVPIDHPLQPLLTGLQQSDHLTQLDLVRLTATETAHLARLMTTDTLDEQTLAQLHADTAGNPLFIVETVRAALERGAGVADHTAVEAVALARNEGLLLDVLPPKVLAVIQGRLGQLSTTARQLCEWAAIVGRGFSLELLLAASKLPEAETVAALDELWQRRIIRDQGLLTYDFSHDRIRDVAFAGISPVRRRYLHRALAQALETHYNSMLDTVSAQIADQYEQAGMAAQAVAYFQRAGAHAAEIYANAEALLLCKRGLALLAQLPAGHQRDTQELSFQLTLSTLYSITKGWAAAEVEEPLLRALVLGDRLDDIWQRVKIRRALQSHYVVRARYGLVRELHVQSEHLMHQIGQQIWFADAGTYAIALLFEGQPIDSQALFKQVTTALNEAMPIASYASHAVDSLVSIYAMQSQTLWILGYPDAAYASLQRSEYFTRKHDRPFDQAMAMAYRVMLDEWSADSEMFYTQTTAALLLIQESQATYYHAWAAILVAFVDACRQPSTVTLERLTHAINELMNLGARVRLPYYYSLLARAYLKAEDMSQAEAALDQAFTAAQQQGEHWWDAELHRLRGEIGLAQGADSTTVEAAYRQALGVAQAQQAKSLELRAATGLARLWTQQGKQAQAHTLLSAIYGWFTEGFDTPDLVAAQDLLAALSPQSS